ncbi:MAG TPA: GTP-binding protein, partial [Stellaceae bacterium]|nr:GTP-binding protein [Stellaceae bacterium]
MSNPSTRPTLPIVILGHVDHGKSTLIGRLLHDSGALPEGKVAALETASKRRGMPFEWSFVMDALKAERDQGITIDTSRIGFRHEGRDYLIIDAPGHREFLKNMLTGAAAAEAALLVIDVIEGLSEQTRRHAVLAKLLGIKHLAVIVNKMDRCGYAEASFDAMSRAIGQYLSELALEPLAIIPVSAREGDMIAARSDALAWYRGPTVLEALATIPGAEQDADRPLRLPVQDVYKFDDRRIIVGRIETGRLRVGDLIRFFPGERSARIASIESWNATQAVSAVSGQSVGITLDEDIFVERGQVASLSTRAPALARRLRLRIFHFGRTPLTPGESLRLTIGLATHQVVVEEVESVIDLGSLSPRAAREVAPNDIADIVVGSRTAIAADDVAEGGHLGRGVLRRGHDLIAGCVIETIIEAVNLEVVGPNRNVSPVHSAVGAAERAAMFGHRGGILWLTGLSGAGKSTLAVALEGELFRRGWQVVLLDGDSLRHTLNADLGFGSEDRAENLRRIGAVARHLAEN